MLRDVTLLRNIENLVPGGWCILSHYLEGAAHVYKASATCNKI